MVEYTIGEVAGAINVGLIFVQITLPLIQALALVGFLRRRETAVTWSVVSRAIQSTFWPSLLSCDATAGRRMGVAWRVLLLDYIALLSTILLVVAGVLTPIGLGESVVPGPLVNATFQYAPDPTTFGQETIPRDNYTISRVCNDGKLPCPGVNSSDTVSVPLPFPTTVYQNYVPQSTIDSFESGVTGDGDLRSDPFQIQYRKYYNSANEANTPRDNTTGDFVMIESLVLLNSIDVREGIVFDTINGGVGFRNHTVPTSPRMKYGATWTEELLWIEIDTVCVDTNWSFEIQLQLAPNAGAPYNIFNNLTVVNRGGAVIPAINPTFQSFNDSDPQSNPDLKGRASLTSNLFGYHLSRQLNLGTSNSSLNQKYSVSSSDPFWSTFMYFGVNSPGLQIGVFEDPGNPGSSANTNLPEIVSLDPNEFSLSAFNVTKFFLLLATLALEQPPASPATTVPFSMNNTLSNFTYQDSINACKGYLPGDAPSINRIAVECGYVLSPPQPVQDNRELYDVNKLWTQTVQVCASVPRATIKQVQFFYNDTGGDPSLSGLSVLQVNQKSYVSSDEFPLWGVENPGKDWNVSDIQLLWGIVDGTRYSAGEKLWAVQKEHLYLPASIQSNVISLGYGDSMVVLVSLTSVVFFTLTCTQAASRAPSEILSEVYQDTVNVEGKPRYDGTIDRRMLQKWRNLTLSPETTALIPNLIWTDIATNMLVGTKSLISAESAHSYQVETYRRQITYNSTLAVPGILCLIIWVVCAAAALAIILSTRRSRLSPGSLKLLINQLSVGRAFVAAKKPEVCNVNASTEEWLLNAGRTEIDLSVHGEKEEGIETAPSLHHTHVEGEPLPTLHTDRPC